MSDILDTVAKSLAAGVPRRQAALRLAGGLAALLPVGEAAAHSRHFRRYLDECREWCHFNFSGAEAKDCARKAKKGKGPCYSATAQGPGYVCTTGNPCHKGEHCCPRIELGPVTTRSCCAKPLTCLVTNGTTGNCV